jgi:hypothetical protein
MKKTIILALFAVAITTTQAQTKKVATQQLTCAEVDFWLKQLENNFKTIPTTVVDETELSSTRKINGFDTCTIRHNEASTFRTADGYTIFKDLKGAKAYYDKVAKTTMTCLKTKQYKVYPGEKGESNNYFQVANKVYGKKGGYLQVRVELKERYDAEGQVSNGKDGYDVSILFELHTVMENAAG